METPFETAEQALAAVAEKLSNSYDYNDFSEAEHRLLQKITSHAKLVNGYYQWLCANQPYTS